MLKDKIKVTFFIFSLGGGGAERSMIRLLQGLDKEKFQTTLLLGRTQGPLVEDIPEEVLVKELNLSRARYAIFKLIRYFKKENPDIFISFLFHDNVVAGFAKFFSQTKTKLIVSERTTLSLEPLLRKNQLLTYLFLKPLTKFTYSLADAIVCVSEGVADDLFVFLNSKDCLKNKIKVIYNPIVNSQLYNLIQEPLSHPWFLNQKVPVLLSAGRLDEDKDYRTLLRAFNLILKEKNVYLVILGEGEERKNLENLAQKLGLSKNVGFIGFQKNPYKYMAKSTLFILSSRREGLPNVLVEAMACGCPVISTDCQSGPNEIIKNKKNGILVPVGDEKILAKAILKVLNNTFLCQKLSLEGRKRALDFSVKKAAAEYQKLICGLLNKQ